MHIAVLRMRGAEPKLIRPPTSRTISRLCIMNHVLHLMLMGLGGEGSISIAYQFYFPVYRSAARSVSDRVGCRCVYGLYARPNDAQ
jgi:hypothetical protein